MPSRGKKVAARQQSVRQSRRARTRAARPQADGVAQDRPIAEPRAGPPTAGLQMRESVRPAQTPRRRNMQSAEEVMARAPAELRRIGIMAAITVCGLAAATVILG